MSWLSAAHTALTVIQGSIAAGKSLVEMFTGGNNPKAPDGSTAEANRHGTESGAARNRSSKATEQAMRGRK